MSKLNKETSPKVSSLGAKYVQQSDEWFEGWARDGLKPDATPEEIATMRKMWSEIRSLAGTALAQDVTKGQT